jgi:DNA-binding IclR family transcriptional regulator
MKAASLGVARVVSILNFLAEHPTERLTLTEIMRALNISPATCHLVLSGLVEVGFVHRGMDKTYVLGRSLARIGQVAASSLSELEIAGPEMRALADKYDVICAAIYREGYTSFTKDRAISLSHVGWPLSMPDRKIPLDPPLGSVFFAWESDEVTDKWLERANPPLTQSQRQDLKRRMAASRQRGYLFGIRKVKDLSEEAAKLLMLRIEHNEYLVGELDLARMYSPAIVGAPVLDVKGNVAFLLILVGFTKAVSGKFINEVGTELRAACDRIAKFGYGG